jgi:hypothetical protein
MKRALRARAERTRNRVAVRLQFSLARTQRLFLLVRGPAPSCRVAGVVPIRARRGHNVVRFSGRVRGRLLEPGIYLLTLSSNRVLPVGAPAEAVRVVSPRRTVPLPDAARRPSCSPAQALASDPVARLLLREDAAGAATATPTATEPGPRPEAPLRPPLNVVRLAPERELPDVAPDAGAIAPPGDGTFESVAGLAVLGLVGALLVAMLALVTRFLRGSWNP